MRRSLTLLSTSEAEPAVLKRYFAGRREASRVRAWRTAGGALIVLLALATASSIAELSPARLASGIPNAADYIARTLPPLRVDHLGTDLSEWFWGLHIWLPLLFDTVVISLLGTSLSAIAAGFLCFIAARNLSRMPRLGFMLRRLFEFSRSVPDVVFALIFVYAFGLGAMAGVLALTVHSFGALGKLFAEVAEAVDERASEGVRATGARWPQEVRYGIVPKVLPEFLSHTLLRFEINIRSASVLGFVGAGGIGQELLIAVRQFYLTDVSAIVILIIATVMIADTVSHQLRHAIIQGGARC